MDSIVHRHHKYTTHHCFQCVKSTTLRSENITILHDFHNQVTTILNSSVFAPEMKTKPIMNWICKFLQI